MVVAVVGMFEILHGPSHRWNSDSEQPLSPLADRPAPTMEGKSPVRAYPACASSPRKTQDLIPSQGTGWLGRTAFNTGWDHYYHMKKQACNSPHGPCHAGSAVSIHAPMCQWIHRKHPISVGETLQ